MGASFVITLREGLEMSLIVALLLAYISKTGRSGRGAVWAGTVAGVAIAAAVGTTLFVVVGGLEGRAEEITEGAIAFAAAGVLTWMIFWMRRQARMIKGSLQLAVDKAHESGSMIALGAIAFFAILREGLETALFLLGATVGEEASAVDAAGGAAGLAIAVVIGYGLYRGSERVNLRTFFRVSGVLLLLFAAGLAAKGVHEFQEAALIGSAWPAVFDLSGIGWLNPKQSFFADMLKGLFGWRPAPSIEMIVAYLAYAVPVGVLFLRDARKVPPVARLAAAPVEPVVQEAAG